MGLWNQKMQEDFKSDYEKFKQHVAELAAIRQKAEWALDNAQSAHNRIRSNEVKEAHEKKEFANKLEELDASIDYINYNFPKIKEKISSLEISTEFGERAINRKIEILEEKQKKSNVVIIILTILVGILGVLHAIR